MCGAEGFAGLRVGGADEAALFTDLGVGPAGAFRVQFALGTLFLLTDLLRVSTGPTARLAVHLFPEPAARPSVPFAAQSTVVVRDAGGNTVTDGDSDAGAVTARLVDHFIANPALALLQTREVS